MDFMEIHCTSLTSKQEDGTSAPGLVAKRKGSQHSFFSILLATMEICVFIFVATYFNL